MAAWVDVCRFFPTAGGTTDWTYASAVTGYQSPALAGATNTQTYVYRAENAALTEWELGQGAWNSGTGVLARTTVLYNSSGTGTASGQSGAGTKITFSSVPQVAIVALKEDLLSNAEANGFTAAQKAQLVANIGAQGEGQCLLVKNGSTLELQRYNGRYLFINGQFEIVPSTPPTLAAPATSGTLYYVYAFMSSGTFTLEASTTAYATDATYGHKIKSGDGTRSLVGMARTVSSAWVDSATQRFVRSWFGEIAKPALAQNANNAAVSTNTRVEIDSAKRLEFLIWAGEKISVSISCTSLFTVTQPNSLDFDVGFDSTTAETPVRVRIAESSIAIGGSTTTIKDGLSEGYHYATGTCTYVAGSVNSQITANTVYLRGQIQ